MSRVSLGLSVFLGISAVTASAGIPRHYPQKIIRFPGGGSTEFVATENAFVGGSWWNREEGGAVFDATNPTNLTIAGTFKSCGYVTSKPLSVPGTTFALFTTWHSAIVVDTRNPKDPRIVQTLAFDMGELRVTDMRLLGDLLLLQGDKRCSIYRWNREKSRFAFVEDFPHKPALFPSQPPLDPRTRYFPEADRKNVCFVGNRAFLFSRERSSARLYEFVKGRPVLRDEKFVIWGLPALAVHGDRAHVFSACGGGHLLATLDLTKHGLVDFEPNAKVFKNDKRPSYPVMRMRSSGVVEVQGDRVYADRLAGGMSIEGNRVAVARGTEVLVNDYTRYPKSKVVSTYIPTNLLHATGVALKGNVLYVIAVPKSSPRASFLCACPADKSILLVLDVSKAEARKIAELDVPKSTTCLCVDDKTLYVPALGAEGKKSEFVLVDIADPKAPRIVSKRNDLLTGSCYRIRKAGNAVFCSDDEGVKRLSVDDVRNPRVEAEYVSNREVIYGVDDFAVANDHVYAISHASLAVFALDGAGGVPPCKDADIPVWSEKAPAGVVFSTKCEKPITLPEGEAVASVVAKDGTAYVAAGYSGLAIVKPDGSVRYARHRGPRAHYNYNYATRVALSEDGKTVYLFSGEDEGCYLAYSTESLR